MQLRDGETAVDPTERNERFIEKDGYWYYTTREGVDIGPFDERNGAIDGCCEFIDFVIAENPEFAKTLIKYSCSKQ
jgi:hypothetical protein